MNSFILRITLAAVLIISNNSFTIDESIGNVGIYLENDYGATIIYKESHPEEKSSELLLKNGERISIGAIGNVGPISIRTNKYLSSFKDLTPIISEVDMESLQYPNKNAIIIIKPSRIIETWDISIHWESKDNIQELSFLDEILSGTLGDNYAQKTKDIYDYNYAKATQGGFINLKKTLAKEIENVNKNVYTKASRRKGAWVAPSPSTLEDLKNTIDKLHKALQKYRARDNQ